MSLRLLQVRYAEKLVGELSYHTGNDASFDYVESWLDDEASFPISLSLPLQREALRGPQVRAYFANLLPEAEVRRAFARKYGVSVDNDYELLRLLGGECAGAFAITDQAPTDLHPDYKPISHADLCARLADDATYLFPEFSGVEQARLSLAGAQDKLPVYAESGKLFQPVGGAPSSHLLKFPNPRFKRLPENELLTLWTAAEMGLPTCRGELICDFGPPILMVERYDRGHDYEGALIRLHQEDFCQSLGYNHYEKYEEEGGPSFARCIEHVQQVSKKPVIETEHLLRWQIFNLLIGNADGHAKNLSWRLDERQQYALAPFYDLVSTRLYPQLSIHLAMAIGGQRDPSWVDHVAWKRCAENLAVGAPFLRELVADMSAALPDALERAIHRFEQNYGPCPVTNRLRKLVEKQSKRTRSLLKPSSA